MFTWTENLHSSYLLYKTASKYLSCQMTSDILIIVLKQMNLPFLVIKTCVTQMFPHLSGCYDPWAHHFIPLLLSSLQLLPPRPLHDVAPAGFHYYLQPACLQLWPNCPKSLHAARLHPTSFHWWPPLLSSRGHIRTTLMATLTCPL